MTELQLKLLEKFKQTPLDIGKLALMLIGDEYLVELCIDNIKASDDELCGERIKEIEYEEEYLEENKRTY